MFDGVSERRYLQIQQELDRRRYAEKSAILINEPTVPRMKNVEWQYCTISLWAKFNELANDDISHLFLQSKTLANDEE